VARAVGSLQHVLSGHWPKSGALQVLLGGVAGASAGFVLVHHFIARTELFASVLRIVLGLVLLAIGAAGFVPMRFRVRSSLTTLVAAGTGAIVASTSAGSGTLLGALVFPTTDWRVREFSAVSNVFGLCTGLIGIAAYLRFDRLDPALLGFVTAGSVLGIIAGVLASRRIRREHFAVALRLLTIVLGSSLIVTWLRS
jgi:uncharacterized membrane protein YfcA